MVTIEASMVTHTFIYSTDPISLDKTAIPGNSNIMAFNVETLMLINTMSFKTMKLYVLKTIGTVCHFADMAASKLGTWSQIFRRTHMNTEMAVFVYLNLKRFNSCNNRRHYMLCNQYLNQHF